MTHELKTWPEPFAAILDGIKRFEIRKADRPFADGDVLHLREWRPYPVTGGGDYTGREVKVRVTYIVPGGRWGLPPDLCVMSIAPPSPPETPAPHDCVGSDCWCRYRMWDPVPSPGTPARERDQGEAQEPDACTQAFRRGLNAAARVAAAQGIDLRRHLDHLTPETVAEIVETLARPASPVSAAPETPAPPTTPECPGCSSLAHLGTDKYRPGVPFRAPASPASAPSQRRCTGRCHCHAGTGGVMHPPCCEDCSSRSSSGSGEREALEAAAKSLEWIANRRASSAEQRAIADVLFEVRAYAESRAIVARRALSASSTDASGLREAAHEALDVLEGDFGHADAPFFHATSRAMTVLRRALSSGSPSPATGDET